MKCIAPHVWQAEVCELSSTTVRYKNEEFIANDLPIEVWLLEVVRQIDSNEIQWLNDLKEEWDLQATSGFGFGPSPALDVFLDSDDRRQLLTHYFQKSLKALSQRNIVFTPGELSRLKVGGGDAIYSQELPTQMVIDVGKQFLQLISEC